MQRRRISSAGAAAAFGTRLILLPACFGILAGAAYSARHPRYSTVTDFARLRGLSISVPRTRAAW